MATNERHGLEPLVVEDSLKRMPSVKRRHLTPDFNSTASIPIDETVSNEKDQEKRKNKNHRKRSTNSHFNKFRNVPLAPGHETTFFDSLEWRNSPAFGFYVLFWTVLGVQVLRRAALNIIESGQIVPFNIVHIMYRGVVKVAVADAGLYFGMWVTYFIQVLVKKGLIHWNNWGWILQHAWQTFYLFFFLGIARVYDFPWIAQIFLVLHNLTFLMKQHSYAMYNGHLFAVNQELDACKRLDEQASDGDLETEIKERIEFCETEILLQSKTVRYPQNITVKDFAMYTFFPTVVYQLEYPRTERIRWGYFFQKLAAVFGVLTILVIVSEEGLYPVAMHALKLRDTLPIKERLVHYPWILLSCIGPFITCYLLTFYLIWDAVLNCIAELTMFGDRMFYRDWWNTVSWDEFARNWNVPVHNFLHRHVYRSSIATMNLSKMGATILTFGLSSLVHELTMYVIFDRIRGYLFFMQLSQIFLTALCRSKFVQNRPILGMIVFWIGICTAPSMLCSLYLIL